MSAGLLVAWSLLAALQLGWIPIARGAWAFNLWAYLPEWAAWALGAASLSLCVRRVRDAAAVGTPVAALFGPTSPRQYGPWNPGDLVFWKGLHCSPCLTNYNQKVSLCPDPACMRAISPAEVLEAIEKRLLAPDADLRRRARENA